MPVFRKQQQQIHSMQGSHTAGTATPASGAQQVEMWHGRMDAQTATPPHSHTECCVSETNDSAQQHVAAIGEVPHPKCVAS